MLFVVEGRPSLTLEGHEHGLRPGSYAYLAPGAAWSLRNAEGAAARFHWIRKAYERVPGIEAPG